MDVARTTPGAAPAAAGASGGSTPPRSANQSRELARAVKTLKDNAYFGQNNEIVFSFERDTRQLIVRIIDLSTNDVLRQIPAQYAIDLAKEIDRQTRHNR
jgi:flagellar protein FlaG